MIGKSLCKQILNLDRRIHPINQIGRNMFFLPPTEHILCGFFIDNGPIEAYVGRIILPICEKISIVTPGFGGRIAGIRGEIKKPIPTKEFASEFVDLIDDHMTEMASMKDMRNFLSMFENNDIASIPPYSTMIANCLILEGEFHLAQSYLSRTISELQNIEMISKNDLLYLNYVESIFNTLEQSVGKARDMIINIEIRNKNQFGIF